MKRTGIAALATFSLFALAAGPVAAADGHQGNSIMIMKHACTEQDVQSEADFRAIEDQGQGDNIVAVALTVLACPTTVLPGDAGEQIGAVKNDAFDFNFTVTDADGNEWTLDDAGFVAAKVSEADVQRDLDGDGVFSDDVSLDLSHYVFSGLADGEVTIRETREPAGFRFGTLRLSPPELQAANSNDQASNASFTQGGTIRLDPSADEDGSVMLHIYNFESQMPDSATAMPAATGTNGAAPIAFVTIFGIAGGLAAAWVLRRRIA